jgi:hypothetical protein
LVKREVKIVKKPPGWSTIALSPQIHRYQNYGGK